MDQNFESHILQSEWDKYRTSHLERQRDREQLTSNIEADVRATHVSFRDSANLVHEKLDGAIDISRSRLVDMEVEVAYEINRLYDKFATKTSSGGGARGIGGECLDVRAKLARCFNTLKDSGECQVYVQKLDRCVTEALRSSSS